MTHGPQLTIQIFCWFYCLVKGFDLAVRHRQRLKNPMPERLAEGPLPSHCHLQCWCEHAGQCTEPDPERLAAEREIDAVFPDLSTFPIQETPTK